MSDDGVRWLALAAKAASTLTLFTVLNVAVTGCGAKVTEPFRDAPRGATNSSPADVIEMPDGFSNVATKCDHGNRVYVLFKGDNAYGAVAVVSKDPTCPPS